MRDKLVKSEIILTIGMLVSNHLPYVRKAMEALKPLLDAVPSELIVVDTVGEKTDGSIAVVKEYTDKIYPFTWCNDFSAARNICLEHARGEWFLYVDDDEWFDDVTEFIKFFQSEERNQYYSGYYYTRDYLPNGTYSMGIAGRIIRRTENTRFVGRIHERFNTVYAPNKEFSCFTHHYGYAYANNEEKAAKQKRNITILKEEIESDGLTPERAAQLVQELLGREETAEEGFRFCMESIETFAKQGMLEKSCTQWLLTASVRYFANKNPEEQLEQAEYITKNYKLTQTGALVMAACTVAVAKKTEQYAKVKECCECYFKNWDWRKEHAEEALLQTNMDFPKFYTENYYYEMIYLAAMAANRLEEYILANQYWKRMPWRAAGFDGSKYTEELKRTIQGLQKLQKQKEETVKMSEKKEEILVTISLLVSNRKDKIRQCLDSIKPLLDAVPSELIVVDTVGEENSDGSLQIAKEYTDKVVHFDWCNDFAAARNAGLSLAKGKWFLYLDDDECFADISEIIAFFRSGEYKNYNSGYYHVHNYRADGTYASAIVGRMIRLTPNTRFVGSVHEHFNDVREPYKHFSCYVNHSGYAFQNEKEREEHQKRNLTLLYREVEKQGINPRLAAQIVQELYSVKATREEGLRFSLKSIDELEQKGLLEDSCSQWVLVSSARYYLMTNNCDALLERANYLESNYKLSNVAQLVLAALVAHGAAPAGRLQTLEVATETYLDCMDWCKKTPEETLVQTQLDFPKYMEDAYYVEMLRVGATGANYQEDFKRANAYWERIKQVDGGFDESKMGAEYCKTLEGLKKIEQSPLLTISLLVSNRKDTIRKCLESIKPLLEAIPSELIIVDTVGEKNSDGSLAIAREYTDHIICFPWCNDFSAARNAGLKAARGKWFLFLDDDEWFEDVTEMIAFFQSGEYKNYERVWYVVRNYLDVEGKNWADSIVDRMFAVSPETHFEGKVHEKILPLPFVENIKKMTCYVHHYGYAFRNEEERRKHAERNIGLLLEEMEDNPEDARTIGQLAQEYKNQNQFEKMVVLCDTWLEKNTFSLENRFEAYLFLASLQAEAAMGNYEKVIQKIDWVKEKKMVFNELLTCAVSCEETIAALELNDYERIAPCVNQYLSAHEQLLCHNEKLISQLAFDMDSYLKDEIKQWMQSTFIPKKISPAPLTPEFIELAKQLKYNIRMLVSAGNKSEAKELLQGLKELIPEDEEISELERLVGE